MDRRGGRDADRGNSDENVNARVADSGFLAGGEYAESRVITGFAGGSQSKYFIASDSTGFGANRRCFQRVVLWRQQCTRVPGGRELERGGASRLAAGGTVRAPLRAKGRSSAQLSDGFCRERDRFEARTLCISAAYLLGLVQAQSPELSHLLWCRCTVPDPSARSCRQDKLSAPAQLHSPRRLRTLAEGLSDA